MWQILLLAIELDDELLADGQRDVVARRQRLHAAAERVLLELEPLRHTAPLHRADRIDDAGDLLGRLAYLDEVVGPHQERRDVHPPPVDLEVTVAHELARL